MRILGIKYPGHDAAAALVVDGEVVCASSQERFDRVKHSRNFPHEAIRWCLGVGGLSPGEVDAVAVQYNFREAYRRYFPDLLQCYGRSALRALAQNILDDLRKQLRTLFGLRKGGLGRVAVRFLDHHDCHAASAFFASPFESAAVLTVDGRGERDTTRLYSASVRGLERLAGVAYPHSLGLLYSKLTAYLGFRSDCDEGTVMALAAFGDERFVETARRWVRPASGFGFELTMDRFRYHLDARADVSEALVGELGPRRTRGQSVGEVHAAVARAAQTVVEETLESLTREAAARTEAGELCLAGGVALNAVANGRLAASSPFRRTFVQAAAGDDGSALGAALLLHFLETGSRPCRGRARWCPYLGYEPGRIEIRDAVSASRFPHRKLENPTPTIARLLARKKVIGCFQGRAEFGPRALGNRSILASASTAGMKDRVNEIKEREKFRPFAPAVLEEDMDRVFEWWRPSPCMTASFPLRREAARALPAIAHVDGSARVQTVSRSDHARFHRLLLDFRSATGERAILNTSFNGPDEPIVNRPREAVRLFEASDLDALWMEDFLLVKPELLEDLV